MEITLPFVIIVTKSHDSGGEGEYNEKYDKFQ